MINRVIMVGRLTKDPELRYTPNGIAVCNFTLAVNRPFKGENGQQQADFIQVQVWRKQAENAAQYLSKGSLAGIDGRWQTRNFEGQDGKRVYMNELVAESVQFLEPKNSRNGANQGGSNQGNTNTSNNQQNNTGGYQNYSDDPYRNGGEPIDIQDDDLPF